MGFVWFSELKAIISLNSINHLILVTDMSRVFFEVGTELIIFLFKLQLQRVKES
jgi:hypothetical protein